MVSGSSCDFHALEYFLLCLDVAFWLNHGIAPYRYIQPECLDFLKCALKDVLLEGHDPMCFLR